MHVAKHQAKPRRKVKRPSHQTATQADHRDLPVRCDASLVGDFHSFEAFGEELFAEYLRLAQTAMQQPAPPQLPTTANPNTHSGFINKNNI